MDITAMDNYFIYFIFIYLFSALLFQFFTRNRRQRNQLNPPPSPPTLPIVGHLPLLINPTVAFHKSLKTLAFRHGSHFMRIFIGPFSNFMVISKDSIAKQVLQTHDLNFTSCRLKTHVYGALYDHSNWDFLRNLPASAPRLQRFGDMQKQEVLRLLEVVGKCWELREGCDLGVELEKLISNVLCQLTMSVGNGSYESVKIREIVRGVNAEVGGKSVVFSEFLGPFGYGKGRVNDLLMKFNELVEGIMVKHEENGRLVEEQDLMDILLAQAAEVKPTRHEIKGLLQEILLRGSETMTVALKWALAEIIKNPRVLAKLREELIGVVGLDRLVEDSDISKLPYLQAVVKESLRLHPPSPLILRKCVNACKIDGYDMIPDTRIMINAYAIMRDPDTWKFPVQFIPERFLENYEHLGNVKGDNVYHLAFGGGAWACPGANVAVNMMQMVVGKLVHCFDFEVRGGGGEVDLKEGSSGGGMAQPLVCHPILKHVKPFENNGLSNDSV